MVRALLYSTVILVLVVNVLSTLYVLSMADSLTVTAQVSTAVAQICINAPPAIVVPCNTSLSQDTAFSCQLNYTDQNSGQNWSFSDSWQGTIVFNLSSSGFVNFTPSNDVVGDHSVNFTVTDGSGCSNENDTYTYNFSVANTNDAPILLENLPDITFVVNTTTLAYFLSDYFADPDGDVLTYTATIPGSPFVLTLVGGTGVQVTAAFCGESVDDEGNEDYSGIVQFTATDPSNASVDSNVVGLTVECPTEQQSGSGSGSGGGGGGGGSGITSLCTSNWECLGWLSCLPTGFEWKQCYDISGCEDPKFLKRTCEFVGEQPSCDENWLCSDWGVCYANGTQQRKCTDLSSCNTYFYQPYTEQTCSYVSTCFDGIKNGDETGVDCGGSCGECSIIETPGIIGEGSWSLWLLLALLLGIIVAGGVYRLYREEIVRSISRILLLLARRRAREILLTKEECNILLEMIVSAENLPVSSPAEKYGAITTVMRQYLETVGKLPENFTREELAKVAVSQELRSLLLGLFDKLYAVEGQDLEYDEAFFYTLSEELRLFVVLVSQHTLKDLERPLKEFPVDEDMSFLDELFIHLVRAYRALQFEQFTFAKKEYEEVLAVYENLPLEDQQAIFGETSHVFSTLKYVLETEAHS